MTQDETARMACKAFETPGTEPAYRNGFYTVTPEELQRFAALVAAAEREECAKVCDSVVIEHPGRADLTADQCAAAIRARGEA